MSQSLAQRVVNSFGLTLDQKTAALERSRDVVVTAGAGSGKTRTLVARYASLLADGLLPRQVAAITFTEKAAREMRSRLRKALLDLLEKTDDPKERSFWTTLNGQMDSARIGTIHSLCAEILRAHPAEAGVDPRFDVIDEGLATTLKKQLVESTVVEMLSLPENKPIFRFLGTSGIQELLAALLDKRLEASEIFSNAQDSDAIVHAHLEARLHHAEFVGLMRELRGYSTKELNDQAGDKLAGHIKGLLFEWQQAEDALKLGELISCTTHLFTARREYLKKGSGKKGDVKDAHARLQALYDEYLDPLIGGSNSKDSPPTEESETAFKTLLPLIRAGFDSLHRSYLAELALRHALDFDDLEYGALQLLQRGEIRAVWQAELRSMLVDEFQDTNPRQRRIVEALAAQSGRLFVVGDDRQSIYRFRRADVTVFREMQAAARAKGGLVLDLDVTYRAHAPLLRGTGSLLASLMGSDEIPNQPFHVPFRPLNPFRQSAPEHIQPPHIEFILGAGADSDEAREVSAKTLALRLLQLKQMGQVKSWDEVALLFRASTGYGRYEDAFEEAGIPFVTVAGRGFHERPEIRDILNLLRALADPADDLAMAGLLRSPAFGLSDSALYLLRQQQAGSIPYWMALQGDLSVLEEDDQRLAKRTVQIVNSLLPQVDHVSIAELLKALVDAVDYRAILAVEDGRGSNGRLWRNLDKLIADAQTSGLVNVRDFLEYLTTLSDAGAREGEAPAEAQGAVRLMTIHKSKGLEFPFVVLADSSRSIKSRAESVYLLPEMGLTFKLDPEPMLYRLSRQLDDQQNEAESGRMLYVAMTRAQEKLIISGHVSLGRITVSGWTKNLCETIEVDPAELTDPSGPYSQPTALLNNGMLIWCSHDNETIQTAAEPERIETLDENQSQPLYEPLIELAPMTITEDEGAPRRIWRAAEPTLFVPSSVIGQMVHKALELWLHADDVRLTPLLESLALGAGLATAAQRTEAVRRAFELIDRFCAHPVRAEIDAADERRHEVPYTRMHDDRSETGYIDLLFRKGDQWFVVDFKADAIRTREEYDKAVSRYKGQLLRYREACRQLLQQDVAISLCFLDDRGHISIVEIALP